MFGWRRWFLPLKAENNAASSEQLEAVQRTSNSWGHFCGLILKATASIKSRWLITVIIDFGWYNVSPSLTDVSQTENSWMLHPLDKVSLGYFAPDRTIPSLNSDWIERIDTRLPTAARFSAGKQWSSMCGPSVHPTEGPQSNKPGQRRRRSRPDAPLIH